MFRRLLPVFIALAMGFAITLAAPAAQAEEPVKFSRDVLPILSDNCFKCHGPDEKARRADLRLDTKADALTKDGPIVPGKSTESRLIQRIVSTDADEMMPPPKSNKKLKPEQIATLKKWIDQGATWSAGVTFGRLEPKNLKPRRPEIPPGAKDANPVDRFLQPYFSAHHIKPGPPVDDRRFARRVYLDVIGVVPTSEEVVAFQEDRRPDKRARLIDALLERPEYVDFWALKWADRLGCNQRYTGVKGAISYYRWIR